MFKFKLSEESQARLQAERRETSRLYGLTNQWLAAALLRLARDARKSTSMRPDDCTYDATLVWGIVPELARRLGAVKLEVAEINWEVRTASNYELRQRAGYAISNAAERSSFAWQMLTRLPVHGNPVVFGVDRLCPGVPGDLEDPIARQLTEVSRVRGKPYSGICAAELFNDESEDH